MLQVRGLGANFYYNKTGISFCSSTHPCPKSCPATGAVGAVGANRSVLSICSLHSEREMIQHMNIFSRSYHRGYILFKALTVPDREPYEILLHKIPHETVYRELVGKQAFFLLFISPKSSANFLLVHTLYFLKDLLYNSSTSGFHKSKIIQK